MRSRGYEDAPVGSDRRRAGKVRVAIIGGGGTGAGILHDLVLRGYDCTLFERGELTSGTTGRHHGQLHSGARYAVGDVEIARECAREVAILRRIASESIEMNYGLFLALSDDDEARTDEFMEACDRAGISSRRISRETAKQYEPRISANTRCAVVVPDGTLDAYRLPLQFFATARANGGRVRSFCTVTDIHVAGGAVCGLTVHDYRQRQDLHVAADIVVNAAGPWAGDVAARAGISLPITPAPGTMVAVKGRLCNMVLSRLRPPGDGDIIVPQRIVSIIGSTQRETDNPDTVRSLDEDVDWLLDRADELIPEFSNQTFHAAWTAVRPLTGRSQRGGRSLSRSFSVVSHDVDGVTGFYSVTGGKATVLRAMGEATADAICRDLDLRIPCRTADTPLRSHRQYFRETA